MTYLKFEKKKSFLRRLAESLSENLRPSMEEIVYIVSLALILTFLLSIGWTNTNIFSDLSGSVSYGIPFESLRKTFTWRWRFELIPRQGLKNVTFLDEEIEINYEGLSLNFVVSCLFSFIAIKTIVRTREEIYYYRYYKR